MQTNDPAPPPMLRCEDAAAFLGLAPATLDNWRSLGRGPKFVKLGARVVYARDELERFQAANTRQSTARAT